jgi:alkylation response protein AidB-like acyl-CoA dehydrogenase
MATNQQRALLQLVREVSRRQIAPRSRRHVPGDAVPAEVFALLAELDLLGLPFSSDDGGLGQPTTVVCQVLTELSQAFLAVGLGTWVHLLATRIVADHAAAPLRRSVLPQLIAGEWLAAHVLPVASSAAIPAPSIRLHRERDHYVLNGALHDIAHAGQADWYVVLGRLSDRPGDGGTMVLLAGDSAGLDGAVAGSGPMTHSVPGPLTCRDVRVPIDHRLGAEGQGGSIAAEAIAVAHVGVAACAVGLARAALQASVAAVRSVDARGGALAALADLAAAVEAADALCERAAVAEDAGRSAAALGAMARIFATGTAVAVTERAVDVGHVGGTAVSRDVERYRAEAAALHRTDGAARRALVGEVVGDLDDGR